MRSLHVGGEAIQSSMRLGDPFALALDYTRCMMAFLLFHPEPRGVLVVNFMDDDPRLAQYMRRLESAFGGAVVSMRALYDQNIAAFAFKGLPPRLEWEELRRRAGRLEARLGLPFTKYLRRLRSMNRSEGASLVLGA